MKDQHTAPIEQSPPAHRQPREREATLTLEAFGADGQHSSGRNPDTQATDAEQGPFARLRELESTTRWLRTELEARNEATRVLTGRLLALEAAANDSVSDRTRAAALEAQIETLTRERVSDQTRAAALEAQIETFTRERVSDQTRAAALEAQIETLTRERDQAVELANVLQSMKIFRYSKVPRTLYGHLRRMLGL